MATKRAAEEVYSFWFSQEHAEHYKNINQRVFIPEWVCYKNAAVIDGTEVIYTSCTTREGAIEPFEDALKRFPDYLKVAEGRLEHVRQIGKW